MNILIAGDYCPRNRVQPIVDRSDYVKIFEKVKPIVNQVDYSIVNLECPVVKGQGTPIKKCGPNLRTSEKGVEALKWVGFDCVTLANNHFYDYGDEGVGDTLQTCKIYDIDFVGGGNNLFEASQILYKEFLGKRLAIVNCCEHEFSIATKTSGGSNPLNPVQQYYAIQEAKTKADYVLVIVHGGHEHWQLPSPRMVETYRFFIDAGADAVVNHHQHCFSGYEVWHGKPIFYGLGNFCFDIEPPMQNDIWNYGYMVQLSFEEQGVSFSLLPYEQCGSQIGVSMLQKSAFSLRLGELNTIITDFEKLSAETEKYYSSCALQYSNVFEPLYNRFFLGAKQRGWVPSFISVKRKIHAANRVCCESHRDKLMWWLNNK